MHNDYILYQNGKLQKLSPLRIRQKRHKTRGFCDYNLFVLKTNVSNTNVLKIVSVQGKKLF